MKFGLINYRDPHINVGDRYQLQGIERVYKRMGIKKEDIIEIDRDRIANYDGEYVILPMTAFFDVLPGTDMFPLSKNIIPVFIGFHCIDDRNLYYVEKYKSFGPFICRDEESMKKIRQIGAEAYLSGCLSLCTEKRELMETQNKVFLVDTPDSLYDYIPQDLLDCSVQVTQDYTELKDLKPGIESEMYGKKISVEILDRYRREAKLVITSRLHCALPCIAMGIPVIVVRKENLTEHRFGGVNKLLNYYTPDSYSKINWNPEVKDIEWIKEQQMNMAQKMLESAFNKYKDICAVSEFFENRPQEMYYTGIKASYLTRKEKLDFLLGKTSYTDILEMIFKKKLRKSNLVIFGVGDKAKWMHMRYREKLEKFKSCCYVTNDIKQQKKFFCNHRNCTTYKIFSPDIIKNIKKEEIVVIVAANHYYEGAGLMIAKELIEKYDLIEGKHFYMLDKLNESANLSLDAIGEVESWADGF